MPLANSAYYIVCSLYVSMKVLYHAQYMLNGHICLILERLEYHLYLSR